MGRPLLVRSRVAIPSKPGQRLQSGGGSRKSVGRRLSQSLPNQVNDFNETPSGGKEATMTVAIPSKPGQRLQCREVFSGDGAPMLSQSLPNQVNDFNRRARRRAIELAKCRNPFQTRSTTSIPDPNTSWGRDIRLSQSLPNQVNDFNSMGGMEEVMFKNCRNPFQTRSTTSMQGIPPGRDAPAPCRNPFQTRSTTSIVGVGTLDSSLAPMSQSLPNQVNDFNKRSTCPRTR